MSGKKPPKYKSSATVDELIADPIVQLTMRADGVAESEFRDVLRAAGWKVAKNHPPDAVTIDGAQALNEYRLGVGVMLINSEKNIFVGRRLDVATAAWQMPQGGVENGEEPVQAAFRELREEIGTANAKVIAESLGWHRYDLPAELLGKAWHGRWRGQLQKWFVMRFLGTDAEINVDTAAPEFSAWKWIPPTEIPKIVVGFKRQLYADLMTEFGNKYLGLDL